MTREMIQKVVKRLKEIASTNFSEYAGFRTEKKESTDFHHCFIVNDQPYHSSNFTYQLEQFEDALEILQEFTGNSQEDVTNHLMNNGSYLKSKPLFFHYLKLVKDCEQM